MKEELPQMPPQAKCTRCRKRAMVSLPSHNSRFCIPCFLHFFQTAVTRGLRKAGPEEDTPVMVGVSGGKDSLAAWAVLNELGFKTRGLHINLGMEGYGGASRQAVAEFAKSRGLFWSEYSLKQEFGYNLPEIYDILRNKICSVCGKLKRQFLNRLTVREGYSCLATGHNLDDEASRLLGNLVGDRQEFVRRQYPYLPSPHPGIPARFKPLYRLEIKEIRTYCRMKDIRPVQESCPYSAGATSHYFREALEYLDEKMPGTKRGLLFPYLRKPKDLGVDAEYKPCRNCGEPSLTETCPVCALKKRVDEMASRRGSAGPKMAN